MKNYIVLIFVCLLLHSCGKKTTMKGRIVNPVTNTGIASIKVIVTKPKKCLGYDGCGSKTIYETVSDENGYFLIEKRFRKSKTYTIEYKFDENKYRLFNKQVSPAGSDYNGAVFEFQLISLSYFRQKIKNINCVNNADHLELYASDDFGIWNPASVFTLNGCAESDYPGEFNGYYQIESGFKYFHWIVTKNSVVTHHYDTIFSPPFQEINHEILY